MWKAPSTRAALWMEPRLNCRVRRQAQSGLGDVGAGSLRTSDPAFHVASTNIVFNDGNTVETNGPGEVAPGQDLLVPIVGGAGKYLRAKGQVVHHFLGGGGPSDTSAQFRFTFVFEDAPDKVP